MGKLLTRLFSKQTTKKGNWVRDENKRHVCERREILSNSQYSTVSVRIIEYDQSDAIK
jgi:hypothetical protein